VSGVPVSRGVSRGVSGGVSVVVSGGYLWVLSLGWTSVCAATTTTTWAGIEVEQVEGGGGECVQVCVHVCVFLRVTMCIIHSQLHPTALIEIGKHRVLATTPPPPPPPPPPIIHLMHVCLSLPPSRVEQGRSLGGRLGGGRRILQRRGPGDL